MKTLLILAIVALAGCAEYRCPNAPKVTPSFSIGERVAFTKFMSVWSARSRPESFWVDKGDTGIIIEIRYLGHGPNGVPIDTIEYVIELDKAASGQYMVTIGRETEHGSTIEAVVYPDGALKP